MAMTIETPLGFSLSFTWAIVIAAFLAFLAYDFWCHTYWRRHGVPYVPAKPLLANMMEFSEGIPKSVLRLGKKYGPVYGVYNHRVPGLICGDPDMIKSIMVKSFSSFTNRLKFPLNNKELDTSVTNLQDERWRDVRNTLSPAFSGAKMKQMSALVNRCADKMVENVGIKMEKDGFIETKELFGSFIMDTIGSCAFGLDTDSQANPKDPFVSHAKNAFDFDIFNPVLILVSMFPWLNGILRFLNFGLFPHDSIDFFKDVTLKTVAMRKGASDSQNKDTQSKRTVDFLQLMIDTQQTADGDTPDDIEKEHETDIHDDIDLKQGGGPPITGTKKKTQFTEAELVGQATIFFIAGYDTTKTLLMFAAYELARHTEIQERLIREVDELVPARDDVTYSSISKLQYLDQVFCETLRCYPPAAISDRICNETFTYKNITIPKGMQVIFPIISIHRDPELWPEPEKFDPERFTKEERERRHPFAWIPFGGGPRICLGMRFALMEAKMATVRILQKYRFETCPQTQIPPEFGKAGLLSPPHGIALRAIKRTDNA